METVTSVAVQRWSLLSGVNVLLDPSEVIDSWLMTSDLFPVDAEIGSGLVVTGRRFLVVTREARHRLSRPPRGSCLWCPSRDVQVCGDRLDLLLDQLCKGVPLR